ncbi:MAG: sulfite exporter TauE/SafE family protein [Polyangiaceae bacterium]
MDATRAALLAAAAFVAGAINSVAGGGTIVSFPAAVAAGLSSVVANASNAVALTPSALASAWAYRRELRAGMPELRLLLIPSILGGITGAGLLLVTPESIFDASVPVLLLLATAMLVIQNLRRKPAPRSKRVDPAKDAEAEARAGAKRTDTDTDTDTDTRTNTGTAAGVGTAPVLTAGRRRAMASMFLVAVYGGYFGAGMGIMTLAVLGCLGARDIHRMNGMKTVIGVAVNGTAAIGFLLAGAVHPTVTLVMCVGGTAGGFAGAAIARKVDPSKVRWLVVAIGATLTAILAWQRYG